MTVFSQTICDDLFATLQHRVSPNLSAFIPLRINHLDLGLLNPTFAQQITQDIHTIIAGKTLLTLNNLSWEEVGEILQNVVQQWHDNGLYNGWRDEKYAVCDHSGKLLFALERSAFRPLGFLSQAIHLNAWVEKNGNHFTWIGKRSSHKAVAPNKLDTTAGGGIAVGETAHSAMVRESWEEAGISSEFTNGLQKNGTMFSLRPVHRGLHREILHLYDFRLPENFIPTNQDGEVAEFHLMNDEEIVQAIIADEFMEDSALTLLINMYHRQKLIAHHPISHLINKLQDIEYMKKYCIR